MALIKCAECGKEISDKAKQCPKCGWKVNLKAIRSTEIIKEAESKISVLFPKNMDDENFYPESEYMYFENFQENEEFPKEKGRYLKAVLIIGVVIIALVVWSIILVNMTANSITKKLNKPLDYVSKEEIVSIKPKPTNEAEVETKSTDIATDDKLDDDKNDSVNMVEQQIQEEIEETGQVEGITSISTQDKRLEVSLDNYVSGTYPDLIFTVKNVSSEEITISVNKYQYINDTSVLNFGTINYNPTIPAGKATVVKFSFNKSDLTLSRINKIEFVINTYDNSENTIESSYVFSDLNITY